jgi:hypothetical protein
MSERRNALITFRIQPRRKSGSFILAVLFYRLALRVAGYPGFAPSGWGAASAEYISKGAVARTIAVQNQDALRIRFAMWLVVLTGSFARSCVKIHEPGLSQRARQELEEHRLSCRKEGTLLGRV